MFQTQTESRSTKSRCYQIQVEGKIDPGWLDWFNGMQVSSRTEKGGRDKTILTGEVNDQVALRGLLNRLWDLNLSICSIQEIDPES